MTKAKSTTPVRAITAFFAIVASKTRGARLARPAVTAVTHGDNFIVQSRAPWPDAALREWQGERVTLASFTARVGSVAAARQNRPQMPRDWCPFCPGSGQVPDHYDTFLYPNDFAAFSDAYPPFDDNPGLFHQRAARSLRRGALPSRPQSDALGDDGGALAQGWWICGARAPRSFSPIPKSPASISSKTPGEAIGVTMPHPHGQIYALPFLPPLVERELDSAASSLRSRKRMHLLPLTRQ